MILSFISIRKVPRKGFQHFPRVLANVNKWKIMFDPSNQYRFQTRIKLEVSSGTILSRVVRFY